MKDKKILLATGIFPPDIGGPATQTYNLARLLQKKNKDFEVLTYANEYKEFDFPVRRVNNKQNIFLRYCKYFYQVLKRGRNYDVIYCQGAFSEGIPCVLANLILRKRMILRVGGDFVWELAFNSGKTKDTLEDFHKKRQGLKVGLLNKLHFFILKRVDLIISPTNYYKTILVSRGIKESKIKVIRNALSIDLPEETKEKRHEKKKALYVGRLTSLKNIDKVILSLRENDDFEFIIVGDGPEKVKLKNLAKEEGVADKVKFLGYKSHEDLRDIYSQADCFVHVSHSEVSPNVLIEAMAYDLMILYNDSGGGVEILGDYPNKILLENLSEKEVHTGIIKCFKAKKKSFDTSKLLFTYSMKRYEKEIEEVLFR